MASRCEHVVRQHILAAMQVRDWCALLALLLPLPVFAQTRPSSATTQPFWFADAPTAVRGVSTVSQLYTLRNLMTLYSLQHDDGVLTFSHVADWSAFLGLTDKTGRLDPPAGTRPLYGPYLAVPPINALTGHSRLCEIGKVTADAGWVWDSRGKGPLVLIALPDQEEPVADYLVSCNVAIKCPEIRVQQQPGSTGRDLNMAIFAVRHPDLMAPFNAKLRLEIARAHLSLAVPEPHAIFPTFTQMRGWHVLLAPPGQGAVTPGRPVRPSLPYPLGNPLRSNATKIVAAGAAQDDHEAGWTYSAEHGALRIVVPAGFIPNQTLGPDDIEHLPAVQPASSSGQSGGK